MDVLHVPKYATETSNLNMLLDVTPVFQVFTFEIQKTQPQLMIKG